MLQPDVCSVFLRGAWKCRTDCAFAKPFFWRLAEKLKSEFTENGRAERLMLCVCFFVVCAIFLCQYMYICYSIVQTTTCTLCLTGLDAVVVVRPVFFVAEFAENLAAVARN